MSYRNEVIPGRITPNQRKEMAFAFALGSVGCVWAGLKLAQQELSYQASKFGQKPMAEQTLPAVSVDELSSSLIVPAVIITEQSMAPPSNVNPFTPPTEPALSSLAA